MAKGEWTPELLKEHYDERLAELTHRLDGFPQLYLSEQEGDELRKTLDTMRQDHVQRRELSETRSMLEEVRSDYVSRREIDELKKTIELSSRENSKRFAESSGRRTAWAVAGGIVIAVLTLLYGASYKNALTHAEVSQQIATEAPWIADRPQIEARLTALEKEHQRLEDRIAAIDALDRFFCKTRQPVLPAC